MVRQELVTASTTQRTNAPVSLELPYTAQTISIDNLAADDPLRQITFDPEQRVCIDTIKNAGDAGIDRAGIETGMASGPLHRVNPVPDILKAIRTRISDNSAVSPKVYLETFFVKTEHGRQARFRFVYPHQEIVYPDQPAEVVNPPLTVVSPHERAATQQAANDGISEPTGSEIVAHEGNQDKMPFEDFFTTYQNDIYQYTYRLMGNPEDAFDFAQDAFLKAWRRWLQFNGKNPRAWIYKIATNTCLDELRRRRRIHWLPWESFVGAFHPAQVTNDDPLKEVLELEKQQEVQAVLDKMHPRYRVIILLREYQGLSYAGIAEATGCSVEAIKTALFRAREDFRKKYRQMFGRNLVPSAT